MDGARERLNKRQGNEREILKGSDVEMVSALRQLKVIFLVPYFCMEGERGRMGWWTAASLPLGVSWTVGDAQTGFIVRFSSHTNSEMR